MTADALRLRRARRAIYGPPILGMVGVALVASGVLGLATHEASTDRTSPPAIVPPATLDVSRSFVLVDLRGRLYPGGATDAGTVKRATLPRGATVVAAATAQYPEDGYWLATRDGRVLGVGTASLGQPQVRPRTPPTVGIAASTTRGYWLARADGRVDAFGAPHRGDLSRTRHAPVVGIAPTPDGGYWLALSNGTVKGFGTAKKGGAAQRLRNPRIVGIAASTNGGYWLAGADGRVYAVGAPRFGDAGRVKLRRPIAGIAPSPDGGYWLTTADGRVYSFGNQAATPHASPGVSRIVAIITR
jgi:hypothetical protein